MNDSSKKEVKLYIKYIPISFTNESLRNILLRFGNVINVSIDKPPFKHTKFAYAFVTVATMRDAENIIGNVNKKPPLNLLVELAKERIRNAGPLQEFLQKKEMFDQKYLQYNQMNGMVNGEVKEFLSLDVGKDVNPKVSSVNTSSPARKLKSGICIKCSKTATKRCSVCKAFYCSLYCQYEDWFEHQFKCRTPPPLEETASFETCQNDGGSKSFPSDSGLVMVKENEKAIGSDDLFPSDSGPDDIKENEKAIGSDDLFPSDSGLDDVKENEKAIVSDNPFPSWSGFADIKSKEKAAVFDTFATHSGQENIKGNVKPLISDELDSHYSFSRLLKSVPCTSNKQEVNSHITGIKESSFCQSVGKLTENDIPHFNNEEQLSEQDYKKVSPNIQCTENVFKNGHVNKNLVNLPHCTNNIENENTITKPKKLLKKDIPTEKLQTGSEHYVFPTYLDGDKLYVQLVSDQKSAMIKEMADTMGNSCSLASPPETIHISEVVCCYISQHDTWYRGEVLEISKGKVLVHLFDFGYEEMLNLNDIRVCDPKFKNFPVMAHPVSPIYDCLQARLSESLNLYIEECNPILMVVVEENPLKVELLDVTGQLRIIPDKIPEEEPQKFKVKQENDENSKAVQLLKSGEVKPCMLMYDECPSTSLPVKDDVDIFILTPDNPLSIFAIPMENVELYQDLEVLSAEMNEFCNSFRTIFYEPCEGEVCIAKFSADNLWYRAACITVNKDSALVVFVDYGNQEVVPFKNICQMVDKFLAIPLIALHCRIKGFTKEEVLAGDTKLEEKFKALLPPNSTQTVNVLDKCEGSQIYTLDIPSLDIESLKRETL